MQTEMDAYRINVKDLCEDEVNYELLIRGYSIDEPSESKRRTLRKILRQSEDPNLTLQTHFKFEDDFENVPLILEKIEHAIRDGRSTGCYSRLVHYHRRVRRYVPQNKEQKENQRLLLFIITDLTKKYYDIDLFEAIRLEPVFRLVTSGNLPAPSRKSLRTSMDAHRSIGGHEPGHLPEETGAVGGQSLNNSRRSSNPFVEDDAIRASREAEYRALGAYPKSNNRGQFVGDINSGTSRGEGGPTEPRSNGNLGEMNPASSNHGSDLGNQGRDVEPPTFKADLAGRSSVSRNRVGCNTQSTHPWVTAVLGTERQEIRAASSPAPRVSERGNRTESEYIHASDIESYVKSYLEKIVKGDSAHPLVHEALINQLTDQITNVGIHDTEVSRISRGVESHPTSGPELVPPLQLSSHGLPLRQENEPITSARTMPNDYWHIPTNNFESRPPSRQREFPQPRVTSANSMPPAASYMPAPQMYARRLPHQQCNIIEKWPKFSGDNSQTPVTDFLRQIDILCRSYAITKEELRMHAHLLFKDSAFVWYSTYEEKFDSWQTLEFYLKMRYDNPNRDRILREELRNRKQRPNELFSAFLTDIETLAQRMNHKMSERDKFELITENMKVSYKRRLALEPIHSIEHLAQLCFKFDALEPNLYHVGNSHRSSVNQVDVEDLSDDEVRETEEDQVFAIQGHSNRFNRKKSEFQPKTSSTKGESGHNVGSKLSCWNCGQAGHMWRDCTQRKVLFCHICGRLDTTAYRCPNQHNVNSGSGDEEKNQ